MVYTLVEKLYRNIKYITLEKRKMKKLKSLGKFTKVFLILLDIFIVAISYILVQIFMGDINVFTNSFKLQGLTNSILISILIYEIFLNLYEVYRNITMYESAKEYFSYALVCMVSANTISMVGIIFDLNLLPPKQILWRGIPPH